jgi:hypothetical protein
MEIDRAVLAGRPHSTSGGRPLNDDIVDLLFTLMIGGVDGPHISDGVDQATQPATGSFPYLAVPNPNPPPLTPPFALRAVPGPSAPRPSAPGPSLPGPSVPGVAGADWGIFIDLLTLRGQVLGRITDYERAAELAGQLAARGVANRAVMRGNWLSGVPDGGVAGFGLRSAPGRSRSRM